MNSKLRKVKLRGFVFGISALLFLAIGIIMFQKQTTQAATSYPYLIKVNKIQNCVTIYEKDKNGNYTKPVKAMVCSTGWATPTGTYKTPSKYRWKALIDEVWGQYSTRIVDGILFHSVWYYNPDPSTLSAAQYNKLGITCSHGCIRLTVEDAKWIYDNCPIGTTVMIYNDSKSPGPLGKPQAIKLQAGTKWDPTDVTNPNNPFNDKKPSISGAVNKTIKFGTEVDLKKGITAKSTTGFSITSDIKVTGTVNVKKAGKYKITYNVTDLLGRKASKTIYYTVLPDDSKPEMTGVKDNLVGPDFKINKTNLLKGIKVKVGEKSIDTKKVEVNIKDNKDNTYTITYSYTASNGKKVIKKSKLTVDNIAPVIEGAVDKEIAWDTSVDTKFAMEDITVTDNVSSTKKIKISAKITKNDNSTYSIIYTAADEFGNTAVKEVTYTVADFLKFEGIFDKTIAPDTYVDETFVKEGVTAWNKDTNITDEMEVTISDLGDGTFVITYVIRDGNSNEEMATAVFSKKAQE